MVSVCLMFLFNHSVISDSLQTHGHARLPCPSPFLRVCSKLMSTEWMMPSSHLILCHPLLLLSSIFPSIRVFSNMSALHSRWPKYWSFSFTISPSKNIQDLFPLGWTGLISLQSKELSSFFSSTTVQKHQFFSAQLSLWFTLKSIHDYWKNHNFD